MESTKDYCIDGQMASQKRSRWDSSSSDDDESKHSDKGMAIARRRTAEKGEGEIQTSNLTIKSPNTTEDKGKAIETVDMSENAMRVTDHVDNGTTRSAATSVTANDKTSPRESSQRSHNPLFHGCRSVDVYRRLNFIDEGTYGMVFRAHCLTTGEEVALKQVKMTAHDQKVGFPITALRETNILLALRHPNM